MARLSEIEYVESMPDSSVQFNISGVFFGLELAGTINIDEELVRLDKELNKIEDEISMVENKLNNSQFIENAPKDVIDKQRKMKLDLSEQKAQIIMIQGKIKKIN